MKIMLFSLRDQVEDDQVLAQIDYDQESSINQSLNYVVIQICF